MVGYGRHWDDALTLEDVDLTGSDRAFLSVELFRHLGYGALGSVDASTGQWLIGDLWDDVAMMKLAQLRLDGRPSPVQHLLRLQESVSLGHPSGVAMTTTVPSRSTAMAVLQKDATITVSSAPVPTTDGATLPRKALVSSTCLHGLVKPLTSIPSPLRIQGRLLMTTNLSGPVEMDMPLTTSPSTSKTRLTSRTHKHSNNHSRLTNLGPGEEETASISANLLNDTIYRISATSATMHGTSKCER